MYSLIKFLAIEPFDIKSNWSYYISKPIRFSNSETSLGAKRLQTLMKSITLRRTKDQKINGQPILNIPPKSEKTLFLEFDVKEKELYKRMQERALALVQGLQSKGTIVREIFHFFFSKKNSIFFVTLN